MDRLDRYFDFSQRAIGLRGERQELLAANIANADTPGYKARDFDFGQVLQQQMVAAAPAVVNLTLTSARHLPGHSSASPDFGTALYRVPFQPALDGNTVEMNVERVQFMDNSLRYQTDLTVLTGRIKDLKTAMSS